MLHVHFPCISLTDSYRGLPCSPHVCFFFPKIVELLLPSRVCSASCWCWEPHEEHVFTILSLQMQCSPLSENKKWVAVSPEKQNPAQPSPLLCSSSLCLIFKFLLSLPAGSRYLLVVDKPYWTFGHPLAASLLRTLDESDSFICVSPFL